MGPQAPRVQQTKGELTFSGGGDA
ncbi:MAG: hypothetical protein EZS28_007621 [Streblomastix strix]|uniref:Uncharacterized protein n=1 Tax=Streblomastix strix TaxID=222440 RepID=A0A5J4WR30_9EUKA|nr:MAG: hypothetical protein EZS28_007621 [Streblomastix strix]